MFKEEYQGGSHVEIFTICSKEPLRDWKIADQTVTEKIYEKDAKGFVLSVRGASSGTSHVKLPRDPKISLYLIQPYIHFQLFIPRLHDFYIEIGVRDSTGTRRRLLFSSNQKEPSINILHSRLPLLGVCAQVWMDLCIDVASWTNYCWPNCDFYSTATLLLAGTFKLRRILTLKFPPLPSSIDGSNVSSSMSADFSTAANNDRFEPLPRTYQFPNDVRPHATVLLSASAVVKSSVLSSGNFQNNNSKFSNTSIANSMPSSAATAVDSPRAAFSADVTILQVPRPPKIGSKKKTGSVRHVTLQCVDHPEKLPLQFASSAISPAFNGKSGKGDQAAGNVKMQQPSNCTLPDSICDTIDILNGKVASVPLVEQNQVILSVVATKRLATSASLKKTFAKAECNDTTAVATKAFVRQTFCISPALPVACIGTSQQQNGCAISNSCIINDANGEVWAEMLDDQTGPDLNRDFAIYDLRLEDYNGTNPDFNTANGAGLNNQSQTPQSVQKSNSYDARRYSDEVTVMCTSISKRPPHGRPPSNASTPQPPRLPYKVAGREALKTDEIPSNQSLLDDSVNNEIEVIFDPLLKCYCDPKTGKWYELLPES